MGALRQEDPTTDIPVLGEFGSGGDPVVKEGRGRVLGPLNFHRGMAGERKREGTRGSTGTLGPGPVTVLHIYALHQTLLNNT